MSTSSVSRRVRRSTVTIAIHVENEEAAPGIKRGGCSNIVRHSVEVLADVDKIPSSFTALTCPVSTFMTRFAGQI